MSDCPFCNFEHSISKLIHHYRYCNLFLRADRRRNETRQAAGFLTSKDHVATPADLSVEAWQELQLIIKDSGSHLCRAAGVTYLGQEAVGFNQGYMIGQTVDHAHVHIFPVAKEDPEELKHRNGMSAAFEALRRERLGWFIWHSQAAGDILGINV